MTDNPIKPKRSNTGIVVICLSVVAGMTGLSYAAVPLYQIFCQVTGFGGTTQRADGPADRILDRTMKVQFDANSSTALPWEFAPAQRQVTLKIGEKGLAFYRAQNTSDREVNGTATFNVSPPSAGIDFSKVECFCFTEQTLKPWETVDMPVMFFIDPDIEHDEDLNALKTITLSYTFYPAEQSVKTTSVTGSSLQSDGIEVPVGAVN
ncbi:MAG: cytochrome c oxidase assembly protein [Aestuariivirgaceae bacterium]